MTYNGGNLDLRVDLCSEERKRGVVLRLKGSSNDFKVVLRLPSFLGVYALNSTIEKYEKTKVRFPLGLLTYATTLDTFQKSTTSRCPREGGLVGPIKCPLEDEYLVLLLDPGLDLCKDFRTSFNRLGINRSGFFTESHFYRRILT